MKIKISKLRKIIKEEIDKLNLQEKVSDDDIEQEIEEWIKLSKEMDSLKLRIKVLSTKSEQIEKRILPIIQDMEDQKAIVSNSIVQFKERKITSPSYKTMFEAALTKVNEATKAVLLDIKEKYTTHSIKQYLKLNETFVEWLKSLFGKLNIFKYSVSRLQKIVNKELKEEVDENLEQKLEEIYNSEEEICEECKDKENAKNRE